MDDENRVGKDVVNGHLISTVRLSSDIQMMDSMLSTIGSLAGHERAAALGKPGVYETMIFAEGSWSDLYMARYYTEEEAHAGHEDVVSKVRTGELP